MSTKKVPRSALVFRESNLIPSASFKSNDGKRRFRMQANSGGIIQDHWYWGNFAIDLSGLEIGRQNRPALREHDSNRIVGFTESITKDSKDGLVAEGLFSDTVDGNEVLKLADEGFPWEASVYVPPLSIEYVQAGAQAQVNGQTLNGPGAIFRKSKLREVSFCALGADENTAAVALSDGIDIEIEEQAMDYSKLTAAEIVKERPDLADAFRAEGKQESDKALAAALSAARDEATKSERERAASIVKQAQSFGFSDLAEKFVNDGMDTEAAISALKDAKIEQLSKSAPKTPGPSDDAPGDPSQLSDEEQWKAQFAKDSKIRGEFGSEGVYLAFKRAETGGKARILSRA